MALHHGPLGGKGPDTATAPGLCAVKTFLAVMAASALRVEAQPVNRVDLLSGVGRVGNCAARVGSHVRAFASTVCRLHDGKMRKLYVYIRIFYSMIDVLIPFQVTSFSECQRKRFTVG